MLRRGVGFEFRPVPCGVTVVFPARAGDQVEYSVFFRSEQLPQRPDPVTLTDGVQRIRMSPPPAGIVFNGGYSSAIDARLMRARLRFAPAQNGPIEIEVCAEAA
jgi:hypothetical protein